MSNTLEDSVPFKLGQMDTRLTALENNLTEVKADVKTLVAALNQQKGGKATVAAWGTGGVGVGGIIVAALQLWLGQSTQAAPTPPPIIYQQPAPPPAQPRAHADERVNPATPF